MGQGLGQNSRGWSVRGAPPLDVQVLYCMGVLQSGPASLGALLCCVGESPPLAVSMLSQPVGGLLRFCAESANLAGTLCTVKAC